MGGEYPWGKETDLEKLTYEIEDAHPEVNVIRGEAETTFDLKDRVLVWSGHLRSGATRRIISTSTPGSCARMAMLVKTKTWEETIPRDLQ